MALVPTKCCRPPAVVEVEVGEDELVNVPRGQALLGQGLLDGDHLGDGVVVEHLGV